MTAAARRDRPAEALRGPGESYSDVLIRVRRLTEKAAIAEAGVPMGEIAAMLGHRDSRTTERVYARLSPIYLRGAAGALEFT